MADGQVVVGGALTVGVAAYVASPFVLPGLARSLGRRDSPHHMAITTVDLLVITAVVWFTGGVRSEYYLLYYGPVIYAALLLRIRDGIAATVLATSLYVFMGLATQDSTLVVTTTPLRMLGVCASAATMVVFFAILKREAEAYHDLREHLNNSLGRAAAAYDVAHAAITGGGLTAVLSVLLEQAARATGAARGAIALLGVEGKLRQAASFPPATGDGEEPVDATCELALQAITQRITITVGEERSPATVGAVGTREAVYVPLLAPGGPIGVVALSARPTRKFRSSQIESLEALCSEASTAVENVQLRAQLNRLASTDHLTGLLNRREVERRLSVEMERATRHGRLLTVLMIDIDNMKSVNDRYGHAAGDEVVCLLGRVLGTSTRVSDFAGRVGGDEFLLVLPEADASGGAALAHRLIGRFGAELPTVGDRQDTIAGVGISIGIASGDTAALSADHLLSRADEALYEAKRAGRGRFCIAREPEGTVIVADGTAAA